MVQGPVEIFDTTLRDGEQTPGLSLTLEDKIEIAQELEKLGVTTIEAGFPRSSSTEKEAVKEIVKRVSTSVCALARVDENDIREAIETESEIIHIFASTSPIQMKESMRMSPEDVIEKSVDAVRTIKSEGRTCMFSPMDATRTKFNYLVEICQATVEAGADIINIPDTVGVSTPDQMKEMIKRITNRVDATISTHCHNDFGLAVANSIAAILGGAQQLQVTVNGIGERAGNASLEETVMALTCLKNYTTSIKTENIFKVSKIVERLTGIQQPPTKPVVGNNAFSHESGIHAAGTIANESTFEPGVMTPEMVGHRRRFVIGKHAGRKGLKKVLSEVGLNPTAKEIEQILVTAKQVSNRKKRLTEADLYAIAETEMGKLPPGEQLLELQQVFVTTGDQATPTATIRAKINGDEIVEAATGVGPVDAVFQVVEKLIGEDNFIEISEYHVDSITGGSDAVGNVVVRVEDQSGNTAEASGTREDIVLASVQALVNAVNLLARKRCKDGESNPLLKTQRGRN